MNIKKIVVSQRTPLNLTPYSALSEKYGVEIDFKPFFLIEPLSSREFRAQRINILDYTAVVFSSRSAIDAFFQLSEELRVKIPETMKYFCSTEAVAVYLQKHIVYRKRKIFFGTGTPQSIVELIGPKHKDEKFLITTTDNSSAESITSLFDEKKLGYKTAAFVKSVFQDLKDTDIHAYDCAVVYNPSDLKSLSENYPEFEQKELLFISYGKGVAKAMEDAGYSIAVKAPNPDCSSVAAAIELLLKQNA